MNQECVSLDMEPRHAASTEIRTFLLACLGATPMEACYIEKGKPWQNLR